MAFNEALGNSFVRKHHRQLIFYMVPNNHIRKKILEKLFERKSSKQYSTENPRKNIRKYAKEYSKENPQKHIWTKHAKENSKENARKNIQKKTHEEYLSENLLWKKIKKGIKAFIAFIEALGNSSIRKNPCQLIFDMVPLNHIWK